MTGIAAAVGPGSAEDAVDTIAPVLRALARRGHGGSDLLVCDPDRSEAYILDGRTRDRLHDVPTGAWIDGVGGAVVLAVCAESRREAPCSDAAFAGDAHGCWVVADSEIYDADALAEALGAAGRHLTTGSAAELLAASYRTWGPSFLLRVRGPCSAIVLDLERGEVVALRDCFGMRPLYRARHAARWIFASEIPPLLQLPGPGRRAAAQPLYDYLAAGRTDHAVETLFSGVRSIRPAHSVRVATSEPEAVRSAPYWEPRTASVDITFTEAARELRRLTEESLRARTAGCDRVGTLLSGGIDSTALTGILRASAPDSPLSTFSYMGGDGARSEERWIEIVNRATGAASHPLELEPDDWVADVDRVVASQGEPMGSIAVFAEDRLYGLAREAGVPVVLVGHVPYPPLDGSPALLGLRLASLLRHGSPLQALRHVHGTREQRRATGLSLRRTLRTGLLRSLPPAIQGVLRARMVPSPWVDRRWTESTGVRRRLEAREGADVVKSEIVSDLRELVPRMLRFEDRNMAAHGVSGRLPFFDRELLDFVLSVPERHLVPPHGPRKAFVKEAMRDVLPPEVLARNDKVGFSVPVRSWTMRVPEVAESLSAARDIPAVDRGWVDMMTARIEDGVEPSIFEAFLVWRVVDLVRWARCFDVTF